MPMYSLCTYGRYNQPHRHIILEGKKWQETQSGRNSWGILGTNPTPGIVISSL